jgi:hypothetical protein
LRDVRFLDQYKAADALESLFSVIVRELHSDPDSIQWFTVVVMVAFVVARTANTVNIDARRRLSEFVSENRDLLNIHNGELPKAT